MTARIHDRSNEEGFCGTESRLSVAQALLCMLLVCALILGSIGSVFGVVSEAFATRPPGAPGGSTHLLFGHRVESASPDTAPPGVYRITPSFTSHYWVTDSETGLRVTTPESVRPAGLGNTIFHDHPQGGYITNDGASELIVTLRHGENLMVGSLPFFDGGFLVEQIAADSPFESGRAEYRLSRWSGHTGAYILTGLIANFQTGKGWEIENNWQSEPWMDALTLTADESGNFELRNLLGRYSPTLLPVIFTWQYESAPSLTKELIMPQGTPLPTPAPTSVSFDFNFTPARVRLSDSPVTYSRNIADFADIIDSPQTVSVSLSAPTSSDNAAVPPTHTFTGELDLWDLFEYHLSEFPAGGVFVFNVSEASGSTNPTLPGTMTYCTNRFQVRVWICRDGDLLDIHAFPITGGTSPNYTIGAKSDIVFTNRYRVDVNLDITKQVTGQFADLDTAFIFDLTLTSGSFANIPTSITAYVYAYNDATPPVFGRTARTVTITNGSALSFTLYHTERLLIPDLPAGTTFNVTERATPGFAPSARVYLNAATPPPAPTAAWSGSANAGYELSTGNHVLTAGTGRNAADFTNNFELPPPETGLFISNNIPLLIVALLATALTAYITLKNRKKIEELPL